MMASKSEKAFHAAVASGDTSAILAAAQQEPKYDIAAKTIAGLLSYEHAIRDDLSTHVVYSTGQVDNTAGQAPSDAHSTDYAALNLKWQYTRRVSIAGEWLYGVREDNDGASGHANRLQLAVKFDFF